MYIPTSIIILFSVLCGAMAITIVFTLLAASYERKQSQEQLEFIRTHSRVSEPVREDNKRHALPQIMKHYK